jgi:Holliday junction DNA helicase RuvA
MIGFLEGRLIRSRPDQVLLGVGGVGYAVHVPLSTFYEIEKLGPSATVRLFVHTHVREDALALYGFFSEREQALFEKLIAVSGIGPRLAQVVLSGMAPDDLLKAISTGDVARLTTIPGVGKKTAERMVVELRDRMKDVAALAPGERTATVAPEDDLLAALVNLGYKQVHAERVVAQVRQDLPDAAFADLLRQALKRLSRV